MSPIVLAAKAPSVSILSSFAVTAARKQTHAPVELNLTNITSRSCALSAKAHGVKISKGIFVKKQ